TLGHDVHDGLKIGRRARDHPQDLGRRRLLLQRLLRLIEQSDVLDRDHRLAGERLEERDLIVGKRHRFGSLDGNGTERVGSSKQWCAQKTPNPELAQPSRWLDVRQVDDLTCHDRTPYPWHLIDIKGSRKPVSDLFDLFAPMTMTSHVVNDVALESEHGPHR